MTETTSSIIKLTASDGCWLTEADSTVEIQNRTFAKTIRYKEGAHTADEYTEIDGDTYNAYQTELAEYEASQQSGDEQQ